MLDISSLSITKPAKIWAMAGLNALEVKKACIANWMLLGVYRTREVLHKMKKTKSNLCTACPANAVGSLKHYLLYCQFVNEIRENFIPQLFRRNLKVSTLIQDEDAIMISILDPESTLLPVEAFFHCQETMSTTFTRNLKSIMRKHPEKLNLFNNDNEYISCAPKKK